MQTITVEAEKRDLVSTGKLKVLRKEGWVPAVVYGAHEGAKGSKKKVALTADLLKIQEKPFLKSLGKHQTSNLIINLKVSDQSDNVIIKEIQKDVITRRLLHVDFQRISMTEKIEVKIPVHLIGEAPGVKLSGGILEHITREVSISALPKDIPDALNVDISNLQLGHGISLKDVPAIPGVDILTDGGHLVVNVVAPTEEEVAPAAGAAVPGGAAEPEVIAKGKKPEEGEEGAAAPAAGGKAAAAPAAKGAAPAAGGKAPAGK